jgi:hypothetical protein
MTRRTGDPRGRTALFRGKIRKPVCLTLTAAHHAKLREASARLGLTRADVVALLVEKFADTVDTEDLHRALADLMPLPTEGKKEER